MLTREHAQEGLSRAYVHAVAAAARVLVKTDQDFDYGFDGLFDLVLERNLGPKASGSSRYVKAGYEIEFQLKCSWVWKLTSTHLVYDLKSRNYNDLVSRGFGANPCMLIVMCLPKEEGSWVSIDESKAELQRCCYYTFLSGAPVANENSTKRVLIPRENLLNADNLSRILAEHKEKREALFS